MLAVFGCCQGSRRKEMNPSFSLTACFCWVLWKECLVSSIERSVGLAAPHWPNLLVLQGQQEKAPHVVGTLDIASTKAMASTVARRLCGVCKPPFSTEKGPKRNPSRLASKVVISLIRLPAWHCENFTEKSLDEKKALTARWFAKHIKGMFTIC